LDEAKAKLDEQDKRLAQFKAEHLVSMPDREQMNLLFCWIEYAIGRHHAGPDARAARQVVE